MWTWLGNNYNTLGVVLAALPIMYAVINFIVAKRAEAKRVRFEQHQGQVQSCNAQNILYWTFLRSASVGGVIIFRRE